MLFAGQHHHEDLLRHLHPLHAAGCRRRNIRDECANPLASEGRPVGGYAGALLGADGGDSGVGRGDVSGDAGVGDD